MLAASSMNALPIPSSSVTSACGLEAWRDANSPMSLALFSAAAASESASAMGSYVAAGGLWIWGLAGESMVDILWFRSGRGTLILRVEPHAALRVDPALDASSVPEVVEMRDRLAHREKPLL